MVVLEIMFKLMFFVGLNIGIFFCVLGFFFNGMLGIVFFVFFVGIVDIVCVVFIVVLRLVVIVVLFLMMEMLVDVVDGWVGVILVDFLDLVVFIKVNWEICMLKIEMVFMVWSVLYFKFIYNW